MPFFPSGLVAGFEINIPRCISILQTIRNRMGHNSDKSSDQYRSALNWVPMWH